MAEDTPSLERPAWVREDLAGASGRDVRVAVIDSGRDPAWEEKRIRPGVGLVDAENDFLLSRSADDHDRIGHGSACCEIILGLAPGVEIIPVRIFGHRLETSPEVLVAALEWAVGERVDLINLSLGTFLKSALYPLYEACEQARKEGVLVVSAVHTVEGWSYPAVFDNVLGVQAGRFGNVFDFDYRPEEAAECLAQGERRVRWLGGKKQQGFGSSFAAPHISAIVALLLERFPGSDLDQVRKLLQHYARKPRPGS